MNSITIIGPCYNEGQNIDEYLERIVKILQKLNLDYKIILIDDGSEDNTWIKISEHTIKNNKIHGIKFTRNFGHQAAIMAGINYANSEYLFCSDVDLQDPPELIEQMFKKLINKKLDVVFAKRIKNNENFLKKYSSIFFYKFFNSISNIKINEQTFLSFSNFPMRLSFVLSLISVMVFTFLSFFAIYSYVSDDVVKGWTSLFLVISFFDTIIFFILGIMGEYIGRMYINSKDKPLYIIDVKSNDDEV